MNLLKKEEGRPSNLRFLQQRANCSLRRRYHGETRPWSLVPMADLTGVTFDRCQFIEGEPRDRQFCGGPVREGSPYCDEHHARCYIPHKSPAEKRALAKLGLKA